MAKISRRELLSAGAATGVAAIIPAAATQAAADDGLTALLHQRFNAEGALIKAQEHMRPIARRQPVTIHNPRPGARFAAFDGDRMVMISDEEARARRRDIKAAYHDVVTAELRIEELKEALWRWRRT